jgi:hypothetical protein
MLWRHSALRLNYMYGTGTVVHGRTTTTSSTAVDLY